MVSIEKLHNYTYLLEYSDGMLYHGVRSCDCPIEADAYYGTSNYTPDEIPKKTILTKHSTRKLAIVEEIKYHAEYAVASNDLYYNRSNQTSTGFDRTGVPNTPETKQKMSDAKKGENNHMYGKKASPETIQRMSDVKKGKKASPETIQKMSDAHKGKKQTPETIKKKADASAKDYIITYPAGNEFLITNLNKFCRENGLYAGNLTKVAQGKRKHHKGYKARFA